MSDRTNTRRRFLTTAGTGLLLGLAGCSTQSDGAQSSTTTTRTARTTTETEPTTTTEAETPDGPGYKDYHWHGRLFFEVNGELVDFHQPKYYLENLEDQRPETVYFHFHKPPENHAPNEWSNEKQVITFQRALNLLPGIGYDQQSGKHLVTYDGTTYDARKPGTRISITEGDEPIDPTSYEVQHADNYYVQIVTQDAKRNVEPAHSGAELGTLLFDLNNLRVDFSREQFLGEDAGSAAFHFHDDGHPGMWYKEGAVTLDAALNSLLGIGYEQNAGSHVLTYEDDAHPEYSRTYDGSSDQHDVLIKQRTNPVDPTSYELQAGDVVWVYVDSEAIPANEH